MESSGWELHKENIQPLSSGRNVSLLKHSLDTSKSLADHDADIEQHVSELENNIQQYVGDDPIEPYLALVRFLEQQCLQTIAWKKSLSSARMECYKTFYDNPKYENDKRFVDAIIKCLTEAIPETGRRLTSLLPCLNKKGIGRTVSQMYIAIADLQESVGKPNEARRTLKSGIENDAQPIEKLQEALSELEFRIARDLASEMNLGQQPVDSRNFGSSVPVYGDKNDAPVFRNDLNPAAPVLSRQMSGPKLQKMPSATQIPLFCNDNENEPVPSSASGSGIGISRNMGFDVVENVLEPKSDKENKLDPSKWNRPEVIVEPEPRSYEAPTREKITIFTDEISEVRSNLRHSAVVPGGVLKEKKPDPDPASQPDPITFTSAPESERSTSAPASTVFSVDSQQSTTSEQHVGTSSGTNSNESNSIVGIPPTIIPNARLMCFRSVLSSGNEAAFEHRRRSAWQKKNQDKEVIAQLKEDKLCLEKKLFSMQMELDQAREVEQSLRENFETEVKHKAIKEGQWEQQRCSYQNTIAQLTASYSELKEKVTQLKFENIKSTELMERIQSRHEQELEEINSAHAARVEELMTQIQHLRLDRAQQQQSSVDSANSNSGSLQPTSSSNEHECTAFIKLERQPRDESHHNNANNKTSQSYHSIALNTDKLFNATGMSMMGSFMAPPSGIEDTSGMNEISINPEPSSFNASVKMSGATTVYGWRGDDDNKTRFGFNVSEACGGGDSPVNQQERGLRRDTTGNDTAPNISFGIAPVMLPPPPSVSRKFVLYESMADSLSSTRGGGRKGAESFNRPQSITAEKSDRGVDFRTLSENVAPSVAVNSRQRVLGQSAPQAPPAARLSSSSVPSTSTSVSARIAEIEAMSNSGMELEDENRAVTVRNSRDSVENYPSTVGQTFPRPSVPPHGALSGTAIVKNQNYNLENEDEPPFEPYVPSPAVQRHRDPYRPPELPFDTSNLTTALQCGPPPLLNSTPTRSTFSGIRRVPADMYSGNCVHTQRIPRVSEIFRDIEGPMAPRHTEERDSMDWMQDRAQRMSELRHHELHDESMQLNLSPIQETSKENRSSCTTGSSSSNMTSTTRGGTMSGVSMFNSNSRSVSGGPRSVSSSISRSIRFTSQNQ